MIQNFNFSNELESLLPGVTIEETFTGQVMFPPYEEDPYILILFRDGVECRVPPIATSAADWHKFEVRVTQAAMDQKYMEDLKKERGE